MFRSSRAARKSWGTPLRLERLEDRIVLSGPDPAQLPALLDPGQVTRAPGLVAAPAAGPALIPADQAQGFDIAKFQINIPASIPGPNQFTQGRVMLYSETARSVGHQGGVTFKDANVVVGFRPDGGAFTPILLLRGTVEMQARPDK